MFDGLVKNKTQKKIQYEPIENMMFDNFVLIGIFRNKLFILKSQIYIHCAFTSRYLVSTQIIKTFSGMHSLNL